LRDAAPEAARRVLIKLLFHPVDGLRTKAIPVLALLILCSLIAPQLRADSCRDIHIMSAGWDRLAVVIGLYSKDGTLQNVLPQVSSKLKVLLTLSSSLDGEVSSDLNTAIRNQVLEPAEELLKNDDPGLVTAIVDRMAVFFRKSADRCSCTVMQKNRVPAALLSSLKQ
jgi:hypothetical protein